MGGHLQITDDLGRGVGGRERERERGGGKGEGIRERKGSEGARRERSSEK